MVGMSDLAIILAGGASRRMGTDKLSLPCGPDQEKTILEHVTSCAKQVAELVYVAHAPDPIFSKDQLQLVAGPNLRFFQDETWYQGPLGVLGRLSLALPKAEFIFVVAGDLPGLHVDVLLACREQLERAVQADAALVERVGHLQPLLGCYRLKGLRHYYHAWQNGETRLMPVLQQVPVEHVIAEQVAWPIWWTKPIHTPEDYANWKLEWRCYHATCCSGRAGGWNDVGS